MPTPSDKTADQPWGGFGSLEAQIVALRRARFKVYKSFHVSGRGLVVEGTVLDGTITPGMVLLPVLERYPNVRTPLTIQAVESVLHPGGVERVGLVVSQADATADFPRPQLASGTVVDVLEHEPAA